MGNVLEKSCRENQNTYFMFSNFFPKIKAFMRHAEKYGTAGQATDKNTIWRMHFSCWLTEATDTHSEYVILIDFPRQQYFHERASVPFIRTLPILFFSVHFVNLLRDWQHFDVAKVFQNSRSTNTCVKERKYPNASPCYIYVLNTVVFKI